VSAERFAPTGAAALRRQIALAGGIEVFAVGTLDERGNVARIEVHARGNEGAVNAPHGRARAGQVVVHNHPSGNVRPSEADMALAAQFGEDGVGFVIVDNEVERAQWVVEPHARVLRPIDRTALVEVFDAALPAAFPGWEPRPGQREMALAVARALDEGGVVALEAGTGTGKSLAYLAPAVLWALANDRRVVVSTYTRTLQAQLAADDLPALARVLPHRSAVLKGRGNYLCRRRLQLALDEGVEGAERVAEWARTSATGDFAEAGFDLDDDLLDRVESDTDQTLRAACPHFNTCFYYQARRAAAAAHLIVVNHALLLRDLAAKAESGGRGILPDFDRVILDEGHHLEDAATRAGDARLSAVAVRRAVAPLLPRRNRPGALDRLAARAETAASPAATATDLAVRARDTAEVGFTGLAEHARVPVRVVGAPPDSEFFATLAEELQEAAAALGGLEAAVDESKIPANQRQPLLDVQRARRRLQAQADVAVAFLAEDADRVRFLDPGKRGVAAAHAPLDIGTFVRKHLQDGMATTVLTSATLAVNGNAGPWLARVGLADAHFEAFPSPFDYGRQALLALPRDLPRPDAPNAREGVAELLVGAIEASRGGAFVLCTSYAAVDELGDRVNAALGGRFAVLRQGKGSRERLLARFRDDRGSVLFGTDSFWEGVSVKGDALRLVAIPRLPFRVPTEPVAQARHERLVERGVDPFRAWSLPEAVLRLRQGFGRLIRTGTDRGAVLICDRRIHEMWYGRVFLASLPPARRITAPGRAVLAAMREFYAAGNADP
jgi:ATP-dependent DNA helicase DinG